MARQHTPLALTPPALRFPLFAVQTGGAPPEGPARPLGGRWTAAPAAGKPAEKSWATRQTTHQLPPPLLVNPSLTTPPLGLPSGRQTNIFGWALSKKMRSFFAFLWHNRPDACFFYCKILSRSLLCGVFWGIWVLEHFHPQFHDLQPPHLAPFTSKMANAIFHVPRFHIFHVYGRQ